MARDHARIFLSIWDDPEWARLNSLQQWTYLALISSRDLSYCGVLPLTPVRLLLAQDVTERKVSAALDALADKRFVIIDRETAEVCVRTYVRHDGILKMPNVVRAMNKAWAKVHSEPIREVITDELGNGLRETFRQGIGEGMCKAIAEGFGKGFVEGFSEHFSHSPSPFPLPHTNPKRQVVNARPGGAQDADAWSLESRTA